MSETAVKELLHELELIEEKMPPEDDAARRIAIRSMFASVEALASAMMASALAHFPQPDASASHADRHKYFLEVCALSDNSYQIDSNGDLRIESPTTHFQNRVLFALNMRAKASKVELKPREVAGWSEFHHAVKIRNRVTHPKSETDLTVSSTDYDTAVKGLQWVVRSNHRACGGQIF